MGESVGAANHLDDIELIDCEETGSAAARRSRPGLLESDI